MTVSDSRFSRQSFLGQRSEDIFARAVIAMIGMGGGGSHIVQQLAHIGFLRYMLFDPDAVEDSNLNRLIGATVVDVREGLPKVKIAERLIKGLQPSASIELYDCRWQENAERLRSCDLIFGCVDGFGERRELESTARRYLIPYIDIGMDVHCAAGEPPRVGGQVILSMPGRPCMFCLGFLTQEKLAREGERYGDAGPRPQVVWPNGILASTAVGIAVDLLTGWSNSRRDFVYLSYDGNAATMTPHLRLQYLSSGPCPHYPLNQTGDPIF